MLYDEPMAQIYKRSIGFYISLGGDDTFRAGTLTNSALQVLAGTVSAVAGLVLLYLFSKVAFFATLGFLAMSALLIGLALLKMLRANALAVSLSREAGTGFLEALNSLRSIRSMAAEDFVQDTYAAQMRRYTMLLFRVEALRSSIRFVPGIVALLTGVIALGPWSAGLVTTSPAAVFAVTTILIRVFVSLGALMSASSAFLIDARAAKDLGALVSFKRPPETATSASARDKSTAALAHIDLVQVSHHYAAGRTVLDRLDFAFERGRCYAIVGPSGAGKSTLADVMLGMLDPTGGEMRVDGAVTRGDAMRGRVVLVEQQPKIFSASLRDNLLLGTDRGDSELSRVMRVVDMQEFVETLPERFDTLIEYQGANLSGGQKQRLSIARGLLRNPEVLILDEATSALDATTRNRIIPLIRKELAHGILIFITHDPLITRAVDHVLDLGSVDPASNGAMTLPGVGWAMKAAQRRRLCGGNCRKRRVNFQAYSLDAADVLSDRPLPPASLDAKLVELYATVAAVALLAVSPLAALAAATLLLLNLSAATPAVTRRMLGLTVVLSASLLAASRPIHAEDANDIEAYYAVYQDLAAGDFSMLTAFGGGLEVGLPALLALWSWTLPALSAHGVMFCLAASGALVFMLWLEHSFYGRRERPFQRRCCSACAY